MKSDDQNKKKNPELVHHDVDIIHKAENKDA